MARAKRLSLFFKTWVACDLGAFVSGGPDMVKQYSANFILILYLGDMLLTQIALQLGRVARFQWPIAGAPAYQNLVPLRPEVYLLTAIVWTVAFMALSLYDAHRLARFSTEAKRITAALALGALLLTGVLYLAFWSYLYIPRLLFVYFLVFEWVLIVGFRWAMRWMIYRWRLNGSTSRVLIVGTGPIARRLLEAVRKSSGNRIEVVGCVDATADLTSDRVFEGIPLLGTIDNILSVIKNHRIDQVVITSLVPPALDRVIVALQTLPIDVKVVPSILELALSFPKLEFLEDVPIISLREPALSASSRLIKRVFDLAVAVIAFVLLFPVMIVLAGLLYLTSGAPIIFKQARVGENGRLFTMYKFRTMIVGAEKKFPSLLNMSEGESYVYKTPTDHRVTSFGRFLRRYSLDELPQLLNVIKGEMSIVGPRPELPELVEKYDLWKRKRFSVPPGMTGWWQVSGRSDLPLFQAVEYDLYYINNYSIFMDIKIILMTGKAVLTARGAY